MTVRARVLVAVESGADLRLTVKYIRIVNDDNFEPGTLVFEWFNAIGHTSEAARRSCVESIAKYLRKRPDLHEQIMSALDLMTGLEVMGAICGQHD